MPRQRRWKRSKRRECMGGSRKLRSPRTFVGNRARAGSRMQDLARRTLPSPHISAKCHGSALRKSPGGIGLGFRRPKRAAPCDEGRRSEDGTEFSRVIDKAVARIQRLHAGTGIVDDRATGSSASGHARKKTACRKCASRLSWKRKVEKFPSCRTFGGNSTRCGNARCRS